MSRNVRGTLVPSLVSRGGAQYQIFVQSVPILYQWLAYCTLLGSLSFSYWYKFGRGLEESQLAGDRRKAHRERTARAKNLLFKAGIGIRQGKKRKKEEGIAT